MLDRIDYNPGIAAPDGQVAGLWICHSPKFVNSRVKVQRVRVSIREAGALIKSVNKVGAIGRKARMMARIECGTQDPQSLIQSQRPRHKCPVLRVTVFASDSLCPVRPSLLLRHCGRDGHQAEQKEWQGAFGLEPHSPYFGRLS